MSDYLRRYLPEFDEDAIRQKLRGLEHAELTELLVRAYKERRVLAKLSDEYAAKLARIKDVVDEPSRLSSMPDVPGPGRLTQDDGVKSRSHEKRNRLLVHFSRR